MYPTGASEWVHAAKRAIQWVKEQDYRIVTGLHAPTWELVLSLASLSGVPVTIVTTFNSLSEIKDTFDLYGRDAEIVFIPAKLKTVKEEVSALLDAHIVQTADILFPVSIRKGGNWENILRHQAYLRINESFRVPYATQKTVIKTAYSCEQINQEIYSLGADFLFHWTRATTRPWPTERPLDFYQAIIESQTYPRTGLDTLCNILDTNTIVASSRHMPTGVSTVSFSALTPPEAISLMRWRMRYREMSFEPYGIGIRKEAALKAGILPVEYLERNELKEVRERWRFQSVGARTDWRKEAEYRYPATLPLNQFSRDDVVVITKKVRKQN